MKNVLLIVLFPMLMFSQDVLVNGNFESWTAAAPDNWTIDNMDVLKETTEISEGAIGVHLMPQEDPPLLATAAISQQFTISDLEEYTLTFDYLVPGTTMADNFIETLSYELQHLTTDNAFFFTGGGGIDPLVRGTWTTVTYTVNILAFRNGATSTDIALRFRANASFQMGNEEAFIDNVSILPSAVLSTTDVNTPKITIYPNPIKEKVYLKGDATKYTVKVYDIIGTLLKSIERLNTNNIDMSKYSSGTYFLKFTSDNENFTQKIVKR